MRPVFSHPGVIVGMNHYVKNSFSRALRVLLCGKGSIVSLAVVEVEEVVKKKQAKIGKKNLN